MKDQIFEILSSVAADNGLEVVNTTSERTGYPRNLSYSIVGFDDATQMATVQAVLKYRLQGEEFEDSVNVEEQLLMKHDGWSMWYRESGYVGDAEFDMEKILLENDCLVICPNEKDEETYLQEEFFEVVENCESFDKVRSLLDKVEKQWETIQGLEDDEIAYRRSCSDCMETCKRYVMQYDDDSKTYALALTIE